MFNHLDILNLEYNM